MVNQTLGQLSTRKSVISSDNSQKFASRILPNFQARDPWSTYLFELTALVVFCTIYYVWTATNIFRILLSTSGRSELMVNEKSGHFVYRIRSGLQARDLWSASLVYLFNLTVLLVFCTICYMWAAWLQVEINYWVVISFSVLILLAIEYILVTFTIEQIERGRISFLVKLTSWDWGSVRNPWAAHVRVAVVFILSIGVCVIAITTMYNQSDNLVSINPDGTATMFVRVDESKLDLENQTVLAEISGESVHWVPVQRLGSKWIVSIRDKNFADSGKSWRIEFYLRPHTQATPSTAQTDYSSMIPKVTCLAKREDLRITDISYH